MSRTMACWYGFTMVRAEDKSGGQRLMTYSYVLVLSISKRYQLCCSSLPLMTA
jgi:hypothetical protein